MIESYKNKILNIDCIEGMKSLPNESIPLIIADPPYNLNKDFGVWKENHNKEKWLPWCREWLTEAKRILTDNGSIFVYGIHRHLCWIHCYMYELGLQYRRQIIWYYENGWAGYGKRSLAAHYEPILWFSKGPNYVYHPIREPYKSTQRLKHKITKNGKIWTPHEDGRLAGDVWKFPTLAGRRFRDEKVNHPTQKPLALSCRLVKHFSNEQDIVLVPFAGSGSECLAAVMEKRSFIGFELNPEFVTLAEGRLSEWENPAKPNHSF
jgi:site-specific DNA-methyltransferase (adenine-specific)/adenine-specific DNA-methyltransferase